MKSICSTIDRLLLFLFVCVGPLLLHTNELALCQDGQRAPSLPSTSSSFFCDGFQIQPSFTKQRQVIRKNYDGAVASTTPSPRSKLSFIAASGFGASSSSSSSSNQKKNKKNKNNKKQRTPKYINKQLTKTYGGIKPEDIARGTQQIMNRRMKRLSEPLQLALQLYQQLQEWEFRVQGLSLLEQTRLLSPEDVQGAAQVQEELEKVLIELGGGAQEAGAGAGAGDVLTKKDLHNLLQVMTWDASADAKAARSVMGTMPREIQNRLEKASGIVAEAVGSSGTSSGLTGRCLDVGCGFGVMVPFLTKAGIDLTQIYGIDLSPEMIRNANELHAGVTFEAGDFFAYAPPEGELFESVIFCSSLHDLPDMMGALDKAISLLRPGGGSKLVLLHAQGASQVISQVKSNPVLVPRGLPTIGELNALDGVKVLVEPATAKSKEESKYGYLAVLERL